jgi:hypothetical protein
MVYVNTILDMSGPDQVYVWSNCGIAVTAIAESEVKRSADEILTIAESIEMDSDQLNFRHPVHPEGSIQPHPDVQEIVVRRFIFQPTDFASFDKFYADWLPYLSDKRFYRLDAIPK